MVKLTTIEVTKLLLKHKISKVGVTCFARKNFQLHVMCTYVRYVHLAKAKPIHKRRIHPVIRENVA
jgi:hypothetical protein